MKHIEKAREALDEAETVLLRCDEHTAADGCRRAMRALDALQADLTEIELDLMRILEYWNRDQNEKAMADALWQIIETASEALTKFNEAKP